MAEWIMVGFYQNRVDAVPQKAGGPREGNPYWAIKYECDGLVVFQPGPRNSMYKPNEYVLFYIRKDMLR